jgi:beta-lactamase class A
MTVLSTRRTLLRGLAALPLARALPLAAAGDLAGELAAIESRAGGRLGVAFLDTGDGRWAGHRFDERFALCSTFKLPLAAFVLAEIEATRMAADERLAWTAADHVPHMPVTGKVDGALGMTVVELAEATQTTSDNLAANLLTRRLGGPQALTDRFRALGDDITRIDRWEPEMNRVPAGEEKDTTTPQAMARTVAWITTGNGLSTASRETLVGWMVATTTGRRRLRAGLPPDWRAGDKTGTAIAEVMPNQHNDVALVFPPGRAPVVIAAYYSAPAHFADMRAEDDAVLAEVGRLATRWISR